MKDERLVGSDGWIESALRIPSPNCDSRPAGAVVSLIVVHAISLPPRQYGGGGISALFTNQINPAEHPYYRTIEGLRVSSHFLLRRDGGLVQYVSCEQRAWHAGVSSWQGRERCNDFSIGVELEGCDDDPFEAAQYHGLNLLITALRSRYAITDIAGHSDIAPGRKTDPGPCFDWSRLTHPSAHAFTP
jgi:N-acetyl-anhydromuramoyl-L-alanine amidase